jgi:hypothetical protein
MKCHARTKDKLHKMLDTFLAECAGGNGSWPEVSKKDFNALHELVGTIIDAKWKRDCDGDSVINFTFVNRKEYAPLHFQPVRYEHKAKTTKDLMRIVSDRASDVRGAAESLDRSMNYLRINNEEAEKKGMTLDAYLAAQRH